jgi:RNA polymerase sigma factor (TIGR02999 family)
MRHAAGDIIEHLNDSIFMQAEFGSGNREEVDYLFSLIYEELRRLATAVRRNDPHATLNTTALVHEAWLKLAGSPRVSSTSVLHFKHIAARAMRQLLVEGARRRIARKRGGGMPFVSLEAIDPMNTSEDKQVLALDAALNELASLNPRQALMVESRFFAGLDISETAALLNISEATVLRDWRVAKAWLASEIQRAS